MPKAYIIAQSAISYRRYITRCGPFPINLASSVFGDPQWAGTDIIVAPSLRRVPQGAPSIKQVLISLRDPNGIAVRPSGFDCVRPCHSERSVA